MSSLREQHGFSIVELLITLLVVGIVFGAFMTTFTTIQTINKRALDISSANYLAYSKMEEYENKPFTDLPVTTPVGELQEVEDFSNAVPDSLRAPRVAKVYVNTVSQTMRHVVVSVEFGEGGSKRVIQYANFIQWQGVGR